MIIKRVIANANRWTFEIKPIKNLILKYAGSGKNWIDPFAGRSGIAEFRNDLNPISKTKYHMEAEDFCKMLKGPFIGILFDPPYSPRQVKECYEGIGLENHYKNNSFYNNVRNVICDKIEPGGYAISCGWHSHGFGKNRGFKIIEILLISHPGGESYDTIITIEKKIQKSILSYKRTKEKRENE